VTFEEFEIALRGLFESQRLNSQNLGNLIQAVEILGQTVDRFIDVTNARMSQAEESHRRLEEVLARYAENADARMKQMEANLDALIRIITAEHKNGRGQS